jgi:cyclase
MLKKRLIIVLTFDNGILYRTKKFNPDYRYTKNFIDFWEVDEIVLIDISKNKLKNSFLEIVNFFSSSCFLPITVGGGINSLKDVQKIFKFGADKIILNSSTFKNPLLITSVSKIYGNQAVMHSVDCKKNIHGKYTVFINNGKFDTKISPFSWVRKAINYGSGEILINNIDNDGSLIGYDLNLIKKICKNVKVPCVALGGAGNWNHMLELFKKTNISGCCTQNIYHFTNKSLNAAKSFLKKNGIFIRT